MTLNDLKRSALLDYEYVLTKLSNGNLINDLKPLIMKFQMISFMDTESLSPNYQRMIVNYFMANGIIKK